jgi:hypothetical protein
VYRLLGVWINVGDVWVSASFPAAVFRAYPPRGMLFVFATLVICGLPTVASPPPAGARRFC